MFSIKKLFNNPPPTISIPYITEIPSRVPFLLQSNEDTLQSVCQYSRLKYIDPSTLINTKSSSVLYHHNACIYQVEPNLYRLFYRTSIYPKGWEDRIATCLLDGNMNVLSGSNKYIDVHSNWEESTGSNDYFKAMILFKYKDGSHVEDPRAVFWNNAWYVVYTDGIKSGVAKLDEDCNTVYSHYMSLENIKTSIEHDGREKNWIPFVVYNKLYVFYSASPYTLLECIEVGNSLVVARLIIQDYSLNWMYGDVRGGAPPCVYDDTHFIWFFHSAKVYKSRPYERIYTIGAYITTNVYPFYPVKITRIPILAGIPGIVNQHLKYTDNVVFPCGAIKTETGWKISMGVHDANIGLLDVGESDFIWDILNNVPRKNPSVIYY